MRRDLCAAALAAILASGPTVAAAADAVRAADPFGGAARPVAPERLAASRGGYVSADGLLLSFGLVRTVAVDGTPVAAVQVTGSAGGAAVSLAVDGSVATLLQNAADGRRLQTTTRVDAVVNSLSLWRQSTLQSSLRGAAIDGLRR